MPSLSSTSSSLGQANSNNTSTRDDMDLKLGALATINSRVALDSNRKHPHVATPGSTWNNQTHTHLHIKCIVVYVMFLILKNPLIDH